MTHPFQEGCGYIVENFVTTDGAGLHPFDLSALAQALRESNSFLIFTTSVVAPES